MVPIAPARGPGPATTATPQSARCAVTSASGAAVIKHKSPDPGGGLSATRPGILPAACQLIFCRPKRGGATARDIAGSGGSAIYLHLDVTREDDWRAAVAATAAQFGGLDILVNNAGLFLGKGIEEASLDEWDRLCAVNLTGVFLGTKLALPALRERGRQSPHGSAIVNLASVAGLVGSQLAALYSLTKGGVTLFTK